MEAAMFSSILSLFDWYQSPCPRAPLSSAEWPSVRCRELSELGTIAYNDEEEREAP